MYPTNGMLIGEAEVSGSRSYCYYRGNGEYTRLVPVDVLPFDLRDIPARENSHDGMIVVPIPHMEGLDGQLANGHLIPDMTANTVSQLKS